MELIYMYIEKFDDLIVNESLTFSPNFKVDIIDNKLVIKKVSSHMKGFYGKNINNITAIVGKNGAGKTTILDLLGMNWNDRVEESKKRMSEKGDTTTDSYVIVYHIEEDYYGVEVINSKIFNNKITNFNFEKRKGIFYKEPMGVLVKYNNGVFRYIESFFRKNTYKKEVSNKIEIDYISNKYSDRINTRFVSKRSSEDKNYLAKRNYFKSKSKKLQYEYMITLRDKNIVLQYINNQMHMEIVPTLDYSLFGEDERNQKSMKEWIDKLESQLYIRRRFLFSEKAEKREIQSKDYKMEFILDVLSRHIIDMFINSVCGNIKDDIDKNEIVNNFNIKNKETRSILDRLIDNIHINDVICDDVLDKSSEYKNLQNVINYYYEKTEKPYNRLIYIARYLNLRIEKYIELGSDNKYHEAIEKFIDSLVEWEEKYFKKDKILIKAGGGLNKKIKNSLDIYDDFTDGEYSDYNNLSNKFQVKLRSLSEGQRNFLDELVDIHSILIKAEDDQLIILILDEPDQSLHPEWSRRFIDIICSLIKKYESKTVQIVLSSHSPFILSDITLSNSIFIENSKGQLSIRSKEIKTFGTNIHDLLIEDFFMDSTIGEFAKKRMESIIKFLLLKEDKRSKYDKNYSRDEIESLIENIGEPIIARKIEQLYLEAYRPILSLEEKQRSLEKELKKIREELENEKRRLK